jgi:hypothetical protein
LWSSASCFAVLPTDPDNAERQFYAGSILPWEPRQNGGEMATIAVLTEQPPIVPDLVEMSLAA